MKASLYGPLVYLIACIVALLSLTRCAHKKRPSIFERPELVHLILRPQEEHPGKLVNRRCAKKEGDKCLEWDDLAFDLKNGNDRKTLKDLYFICDVGGRRFGVCDDRPGLCHQTYIEKKFLGLTYQREIVVIDYLSAEADFNRLLHYGTVCASIHSTVGKELFEID